MNCNKWKNIRLDTLLARSCYCVKSHQPVIQFVKATADMYSQQGLRLEEKQIQNAVNKRQQEFRAGRHAARSAIKKLMPDDPSVEQHAILIGASREPVFPAAISGSISHTDSVCLAACALKNDVASIGIDVENNRPLDKHLLSVVYTRSEQVWLTKTDTIPNILIFSIKESLFKCLFPFVQVYFDFLDAEITLQPDADNSGQFQFELIGDNRSDLQSGLPELVFHGHYCFTGQYVLSVCYFTK